MLNLKNIFERRIYKTQLVEFKSLHMKIKVNEYENDFISNGTISECGKNKGEKM